MFLTRTKELSRFTLSLGRAGHRAGCLVLAREHSTIFLRLGLHLSLYVTTARGEHQPSLSVKLTQPLRAIPVGPDFSDARASDGAPMVLRQQRRRILVDPRPRFDPGRGTSPCKLPRASRGGRCPTPRFSPDGKRIYNGFRETTQLCAITHYRSPSSLAHKPGLTVLSTSLGLHVRPGGETAALVSWHMTPRTLALRVTFPFTVVASLQTSPACR